jgi:Flp pilus assembly protein TadG
MIKKQDGQSLVEFALVLPLILLLLVAVFDFGRIFYTHLQLELVTQESVRMAGLGQGDEEISMYAQTQFQAGNSDNLEIVITPGEGARSAGDYVTVSISYPESLMNVFGDYAIPYTVTTNSTIRVE